MPRVELESLVALANRGLILALYIQQMRFFITLIRQLTVVRLRAFRRRLTLLPAVIRPRGYTWRRLHDGGWFWRRSQNLRDGRRRGWAPGNARRRRWNPGSSR